MDFNAILTDPALFAKFQEFMASHNTKQNNSSAAPQEREPEHPRSSTIGRSSTPAEEPDGNHGAQSPKGRETRTRSPTITPSSDAVESHKERRRGRSRTPRRIRSGDSDDGSQPPSPLSRSPQTDGPAPNQPQSRVRRESSSTSQRHSHSLHRRPPNATRQNRRRSPSTSPDASRRKDPPSNNPQRSRSRSQTPPHRKRPSPDIRSPSPRAGPSKRPRARSPSPQDTVEHEYDTCPTSYEKRPGKRGGRATLMVDGKKVVQRTRIERLVDRREKHKFVMVKKHLFGKKHGCHFNPYTFSKVNEKNCQRIDKPKGFRIGRGGQLPLHEAIGLRDDYDYMSDIRAIVRKACLKWRPKHVQLEEGQGLTWEHYSSGARKLIHDYVYSYFPFLYHFRNKSGEDSWAIIGMAIQYLRGIRSYLKSGAEAKCENYLRRNASDRKNLNRPENDEYGAHDDEYDEHGELILPQPPKPSADDLDDYGVNVPTTGAGPSRTHKRTRSPAPQTTAHHGYDNDTRPRKKARPTTRSPSPVRQPAEPSASDIRRANKVVANEQARDKAYASKNKVGAPKPTALTAAQAPKGKGKGKGKEREDALTVPKGRRHNEGSDEELDEESDEEVSRRFTMKVDARKKVAASSPEDEQPVQKKQAAKPKPRPNPAPEPKISTKKGKSKASEEPETEEDEEPAPMKPKARPKMRPPPPPEPTEAPAPSGSSSAPDVQVTTGSEAPATTAQENGGLQVVGTSKMKVKRPVAPSTRELRQRN